MNCNNYDKFLTKRRFFMCDRMMKVSVKSSTPLNE